MLECLTKNVDAVETVIVVGVSAVIGTVIMTKGIILGVIVVEASSPCLGEGDVTQRSSLPLMMDIDVRLGVIIIVDVSLGKKLDSQIFSD